MIDKSKNVCYVIDLHYWKNGENRKIKVLSQHSMRSRRFRQFADDYYRNVLKVDHFDRKNSDNTSLTQHTISHKDWLNPNVRKEVLKDITEREKCY